MSKLEAKLKASLKPGARPAASAKNPPPAKAKSPAPAKAERAQVAAPQQTARRDDAASLHPKRIWPD